MRSAVLAGLVCVALSGCFGGGQDPTFASAMELRDAADGHAQGWAEDATLVAVHARERRPSGGEGFRDPAVAVLGTVADPEPGDGRAHAWEFTYRAASREPTWFRVRLHGDGSLIDALDHTPSPYTYDSFARYGLDAWKVDSTGAAHAVRDENWTALLNDPLSTLDVYLYNTGGTTPTWVFVAGNLSGAREVRRADAISGGALWYEGWYVAGNITPWPPPPWPERGDGSGEVSAVAAAAEHVFHVEEDDHRRLRVAVETLESLGGGSMRADLASPNGTRTNWSWVLPTTGAWTERYELPEPGAGEWTLRLDFTGTTADYRFEWCVDSAPAPPNVCDA